MKKKAEFIEEIEFNYFQTDEKGFKKFKSDLDTLLKEEAIEFGIWVQENQGKENFDFCRGDTDGWYEEWKQLTTE